MRFLNSCPLLRTWKMLNNKHLFKISSFYADDLNTGHEPLLSRLSVLNNDIPQSVLFNALKIKKSSF